MWLRRLRTRRLGTAPVDYVALRSLSALVASLPATDNPAFREEFDQACKHVAFCILSLTSVHQEYEDVQLTSFLSALTSTTNALNDVRNVRPIQLCY